MGFPTALWRSCGMPLSPPEGYVRTTERMSRVDMCKFILCGTIGFWTRMTKPGRCRYASRLAQPLSGSAPSLIRLTRPRPQRAPPSSLTPPRRPQRRASLPPHHSYDLHPTRNGNPLFLSNLPITAHHVSSPHPSPTTTDQYIRVTRLP